jgi:radical SAM superfamily enzyme YgiQ (UPF0313 family)
LQNRPKVLLIYPGDKSSVGAYSLGLLYVAKSLQKINIDVSILHLAWDSIKKIQYENYLFVGISMLTGQMISDGLKVAKLIKKYNPNIPIVLGGVHPSLLPEQTLQNELVDIVVIGEGEKTAQDLAMCLLNKGDLSGIRGIAYKKEGQVIINQPQDLIDLNTLDMDLPYELLGKAFYDPTTIPVHTSRGCPNRCSFCYSPAFNKRRYRAKSAERVVKEVEYLNKKYKIRNFDFGAEDEFFIDIQRAYEIFQSIIQKGLKIRWSTFCRFDTFDRAYKKFGQEFIDLMKNSGCYYISFGAESGSQRLLDEVIKKDIKVEQILSTIEIMKNNKIPQRVTFVNCWPTETREDSGATFSVIDKISYNNSYIVIAIFNLCPFPGTAIFELLNKDYNCQFPDSLEKWGRWGAPLKLKLIKWFPKKIARRFYNIAKLSSAGVFFRHFGSYNEYKNYIYSMGYPYYAGFFSYLASKLQNRRYKNKYFKFAYEAILFAKLIRVYKGARNFFINEILKKYLPRDIYKALRKRFGPKDRDWTSEKEAKELKS